MKLASDGRIAAAVGRANGHGRQGEDIEVGTVGGSLAEGLVSWGGHQWMWSWEVVMVYLVNIWEENERANE